MENSYFFFLYIFNYSFWGDLFSIVMLYSVFKLLLIGIVTEMVWPTQLFNRINLYLNNSIRFRSYTEFFLKLSNYSTNYFLYYNIALNTYISYKNFTRV